MAQEAQAQGVGRKGVQALLNTSYSTRTIGADRNQPFVNLGNPPRISRAIRFREQCRAFGIRRQHGFQQARRTRRRVLRHMAHARTGREPALTPIRLQFSPNGTE